MAVPLGLLKVSEDTPHLQKPIVRNRLLIKLLLKEFVRLDDFVVPEVGGRGSEEQVANRQRPTPFSRIERQAHTTFKSWHPKLQAQRTFLDSVLKLPNDQHR